MLHNLIDFKRRSKREEKNKIDLLSWTPIKFAHWLIEYVRYNCKSRLVRSLSLCWTAANCNLVQAALSLHFSFYQCSAPTDLISDIFHWWLMTDFNGLIDLDLIKRLKLIWEIEQNAQSDASEQLLWAVFEKFLKSFWKVFEKSRFTRRWVIEGAQSDGRITTGAVTALSSFCLEKSSEWQFEWRHPGAGSVWLETTFLNRTLLLLNFTELSWVWILQTGAGSVWLETTFLNRTLLLLNFTELYWVWILHTGAGSVGS